MYSESTLPKFVWFGYDPLGRCVKRWLAPESEGGYAPGSPTPVATYLYHDGWNLVQEETAADSPTLLYVHGGRVDEVVAQIKPQNNTLRYLQYDARGHCVFQTDTSGQIKEQYEYDAFGLPYFFDRWGNPTTTANGQPGSLWGNRILFTGREYLSDMRIYDFRHRIYHPELGRFLQPDPNQFEAGDYNLYRYCHNDPVNHSDPDGLQARRHIPTPRQVRQQRTEAMQGGRLPQRAPNISGNSRLPDGRIVPPQLRRAPNPDGSPGKADHRSVVEKISDLFRRIFSGRDVQIRTNVSIEKATGVNRRPDVSVFEGDSVIMVGEAARLNQNGTMIPRESLKRPEYDAAGVPSIFIGIPPNN